MKIPRNNALYDECFLTTKDIKSSSCHRDKLSLPWDGIPVLCGTVNFPVSGTVYTQANNLYM